MRRILVGLILLGTGCQQDLQPAWGVDTITVSPTAHGNAVAVQSWAIYNAAWAHHRQVDNYLCGAVIVYDLVPMEVPCEACRIAFRATRVTISDTDCGQLGWTALPDGLRALRAVGLGSPAAELTDPPKDHAIGGWFQNDGVGWRVHGWAYAQGRPQISAWNDHAPFTMLSAYDTPLRPHP